MSTKEIGFLVLLSGIVFGPVLQDCSIDHNKSLFYASAALCGIGIMFLLS